MSVVAASFGGRIASPGGYPELETLLARIRAAYNPIDVILYGSRARGEATSQSDWDLKVIVSDEAPERFFRQCLVGDFRKVLAFMPMSPVSGFRISRLI
ncbi:nucleotidyltransferase domain-containing protein [Agrobacterium tumefaciens]|uniref:nucleotidyltransferase domain-containing protein n=1 Tax=Agrobacterium tumefaciens TaxID=358 RepID=UPI0021CE5C94|nr:nucleotidyltransferase domain-containing protein [Agrobacterium tumefaciens]UXS05308.1 nucleotidyltransferase domain-containing protein [Agrobacterium tumefaciens]